MTLKERVETIQADVQRIMDINQKQPQEKRHDLGFNTLCGLQDEVRWLLQDVEKIEHLFKGGG